ncbi:MAG: transcription elongation factor subunit Spt4 [Sulfolobales archaeon]|nr:DNA-directed RNA polymerase, subunit E'' [Sulfolobales archaeon]MDW7968827.1 transcription elongation factor subunit Spt4 [Sulfolobales archaeon]
MSSERSKKPFKACTKCRFLASQEEQKCPICGSDTFTDEWSGVAIVLDPEKSEIARLLGISKPGKYALKIR